MSEMVICDERKSEADYLAGKAKNINAYVSETKLNIHEFTEQRECVKAVSSEIKTDMAVTSINLIEGTIVPETVREENADASIMLVADASISPVRYLTPKIKASSLLLRPYDEEMADSTIRDFMKDHYVRRGEDKEKSVIVEYSGEKARIPISQILYVEIRGKRVYLRLKNVEYSTYSSMERVLEKLGEDFVRCHRSFAFNRNYFESVKISDNLIKLSFGINVPLSRTYKSAMKEFVNECR